MKKRLIAILGAVLATASITISAVKLLHKEYTVYLIVESDGIAVSGDEMFRTLSEETMDWDSTELTTLDGQAFATSDAVYERSGKLYLGENKTPLSFAYPFFVNNGTAVFCINESAIAVTEEFDYVPTYQGLYISDGISFNQDMERAYREDFLFLQLSNGLYLNSMEFTVKKSSLPGETLSGNSIISFFEKELRYYSLEACGRRFYRRGKGVY